MNSSNKSKQSKNQTQDIENETQESENVQTNSIPENNPLRKKVKRRRARKQVTLEEAGSFKKQPEQSGQTYNVWYNKWAGGDKYDSYSQKEKSKTRCKISTDAGYTRADGGNNAYCCLYFARGCCPYGWECSYLHRLPPPQSVLPDASLDVFGREKHSDYRDDMGGVGSFGRQNRTLYIGRMKEVREPEELVEKHFQEWGEIERIRVLHGRGVAFVTYVSELSAQFAKEAMMCQSLVDEEVLNVRWATEDPNPSAKRGEHSRLIKLGEEAIAGKLNPELVQAVKALDQLESLGHSSDNDHEESNDQRQPKRARIEPEPEPEPVPEPITHHHIPTPNLSVGNLPLSNSLLSSEALESLKALSKQKSLVSTLSSQNPSLTSKGLVGLADYDSDED
ncbi:uncharacterized protein MELLADRAFT_117275 [Melampsora larici-populina 98AG31]|uniref:Pre-mRNA-splicing factor CWC2 n=1 Tax=Melampsora larici-populina (strain 98AG31 / pathotype 3-4-7) TaxID=747676 RepID=F4RVB5_MELLP|nr:uncharacterized protein MELLADRAFT_117275 [Melampsora larici-populina 98AG31]EGG03594.1 hypothetical protein MELLADRAFT_117275 [Melampsora larici-populina 98AG31]